MSAEFGKEFRISAAVTDPAIKRQLLALELNGNESVNSGFISPNSHNIAGGCEAEKAEALDMAMQFLTQLEKETQARLDALNERINRLEEKSYEALMLTEEQLRKARDELQALRDNAYQITLPDGSVRSVYRDGDVVRTEDGSAIDPDIITAENIPNDAFQFNELVHRRAAITRLERKRDRIIDYRDRLDGIRERAGNTPSSGNIHDLEDLVADLPDSVIDVESEPTRSHLRTFNNSAEPPQEPMNPECPLLPQGPDFGR